ncbi:hypothetical protein F5887DRAFT_1008599 [Amanita rubescens]|nr:hypothetical protein F5887DRAFT_1008599 [Amanita rubescens]
MSTIRSIPTSAKDFEAQVKALLADLEGRDPKEITNEVIAQHLFDNSDDTVEPGPEGTIQLLANATFSEVKKLTITKSDPTYDGVTTDQWLGTSKPGVLVTVRKPEETKFFALDGLKIPYVPLVKFLVIFFYNASDKKAAVYAGKAIADSLKFTFGEGKFIYSV